MHICHLNLPTEFYGADGAGAVARVISETAQVLQGQGHRVTVLTRAGGGPPLRGGDVVNFSVRSREQLPVARRVASRLLGALHRWDWPYYDHHVRAVSGALRTLGDAPDIVFAHNDLLAPTWLPQVVPHATVVVWLHNELTHTRQRPTSKALGTADGVVTVSRHLATWARSLGYREDQLIVAPNGANPEVFRPRPDWGAPASPLRILFLGRIEPNKGPDLVVAAYTALRNEGLDVQLSVAGGVRWHGEDGGEYWERVRNAAVKEGAAWLGRVRHDEAAELMRDHDVLCLPSRSAEGYGLVIAEAKSSGLAVVTSDRGGQVEAGGNSALLVRPEEPNTVTEALRRLATQPEILLRAKSASLQESRTSTWELTTEILLSAMQARAKLRCSIGGRLARQATDRRPRSTPE